MKRRVQMLRMVYLLLIFVLPFSAFAQETISGKVTDAADGSSIPGATVLIKGTTSGTTTGIDGTYSLKAKAGQTLAFSFVGYETAEVVVSGQKVINVQLKSKSTALDEVVVVAYGTRKKTDLTGSVTAVTTKDFQKGSIASSEQLLMGKVTGLQITSSGGAAGAGSTIRIRGGASLNASNDPLIVIDNVPVEGNGLSGSANLLNTINPNDIESVSVLKDASATALYGSRASNGVIIITTKKGTEGKMLLNFNSQFSVGTVSKYVDVLSGDQIRELINTDAVATGNNDYKDLLGTENTNWQKEIYQAALGWDNNISAAGTYKKMPYRLSVGYLTQDGTLLTNHFNRLTTGLNLSPKFFNDHLSVNLNVKYTNTQNTFADEGAIGQAVSFDPTKPVYNTDNTAFGGYWEWLDPADPTQPIGTNGGAAMPNPVSMLTQRDNTSSVNRLLGNVQFDYKLHFLPDLHLLVNLGLDKAKGMGDDNRPITMAIAAYKGGIYSHYEQGKTNKLADVSLFYTKELKQIKSKLDVLAGHSYQDFYTDNFFIASYNEAGEVDSATIKPFATDKPEYALESYLGRINYTFNDKYLLTASIRRDASSKFAPENRVGYFPALALAWRLNQEFFKNSKTISDLKLRFGWGITGQQDIRENLYPYMARYGLSTITAQYQFGNTFYQFLRPAAYDKDIKWETTTTTNIGLDFGFFNGRITGSIDVYKKYTKDLISKVPIAPGANFDISLWTNVGNMENKGVEFAINTIPVKTKDYTWEFGFNMTYTESKVTNLLKHDDPTFTGLPVSGISGGTGNNVGKIAVGYAPNVFNVYKQVYDKTTGMPIEGLYEDINRDGQITDADRYFYKKPAPDFLFGFNTNLNYKKWNVGMAGHAMVGNYMYNNFNSNKGTVRALKDPLYYISNISTDYYNTEFNNMQYLSDYYIEDASFFRLDNINIGYNVGKLWSGNSNLRLQANVSNVFVITKYSGLDPENANTSGVDNVIYPRPRVFSFGLNLDF